MRCTHILPDKTGKKNDMLNSLNFFKNRFSLVKENRKSSIFYISPAIKIIGLPVTQH